MQGQSNQGVKPTVMQTFLTLLFDSLGFTIYFAVAYLVAAQFFRIHWTLGVIYLIPLVWGYFLFFVGPLAEDGQTPGQKAANIFVTRADGKEYKKAGSTGGIGYVRATLLWIISRGVFPVLGLWALYTNFTYLNLVIVLVIYLLSLLAFAVIEDALFGIRKTRFARESELRARVRGFFEKRKVARPQLPVHASIIPFGMLVGGLVVGVYSAMQYQTNPQAGAAGVVIGLVSLFLSQAVLNVRKWARWIAIVFLIAAAVVTYMYNFGSTQVTLTVLLAAIFALDLLVDPTVANAFRSAS